MKIVGGPVANDTAVGLFATSEVMDGVHYIYYIGSLTGQMRELIRLKGSA